MKNGLIRYILVAMALSVLAENDFSQSLTPAFPGAEGSGGYAVGGRFGSVYKVTNLNTEGPGSFADAVSKSNRIIIFTVSGIINFNGQSIDINKDNITIAGQSAPGDGICFKLTSMHIGGKDVIIRHIRSRVGYTTENGLPKHKDGLSIDVDNGENIIVDHASVSWASDENLTHANDTKNVTVQFCYIAEGLNYFDPNNQPNRHGLGSIIGSDLAGAEVNFHHNLYAHHEKRSPRFASRDGNRNLVDFRNNVIYDCYDETGLNNPSDSVNANYIGNYLKYGPNTPNSIKYQLFNIRGKFIRMYAADNYVFQNSERTADNWKAMAYDDGASLSISQVVSPFETVRVTTDNAETAYDKVLDIGGAILPSRDINDNRISNDVLNGTGIMVEYETDLGKNPWGNFYSLPYPDDADDDGIPDFWEDQYGLDKNNPADNMSIAANGYANIEHYLNNTDPSGENSSIVFAGGYKSRAVEKGDQGSFRIYRSGNLQNFLTVKYSVSGDAAPGEDYDSLQGEAVIESGKDYVEIPVHSLPDAIKEDDEKIIITLESSSDYMIGCPSRALIVLEDEKETTAVSNQNYEIPGEVSLNANYPNPFNSETRIRYTTAGNQLVRLEIFDILGRRVNILVNQIQPAGKYEINWGGKDSAGTGMPSGIYFYRLAYNKNSITKKMIMLE